VLVVAAVAVVLLLIVVWSDVSSPAPSAAPAAQAHHGQYGYECGSCRASQSLSLLLHAHVRGTPHTPSSRPCVFEAAFLYECRQCRALQLEDFSHDCWAHDEAWDMCFRHRVRVDRSAELREFVARCPSPLNAECPCEVHAMLRTAPHGRGNWDESFERLEKY
jgi:hypothetical protein